MAVYLAITRIGERDGHLLYRFETTNGLAGELAFDPGSGKACVTVSHPQDPEGRLFARAAHKLTTHWRDGAMPDRTCWAS